MGRRVVFTGLVEIVGEVAEQYLRHRVDFGPLRRVAQQGIRDTELPVRLRGVAGPSSEFRP
jgi:hypothetical protein